MGLFEFDRRETTGSSRSPTITTINKSKYLEVSLQTFSLYYYLRKRSMSRAISTSSLVGMFNTVTFAPSEEMIASERVSLRS